MATQLEWLLGRYLGIRARSEQEIRKYIEQKRKKISVSDEFVEELIARYKELGLIDDTKFAEALTHAMMVSKARGRRVVQMKLRAAGVEESIASQAIQGIDTESVTAAMRRRLTRYESAWAELDHKTRYAKAYKKLLTSGFSSSEIRPFLDEWCVNR